MGSSLFDSVRQLSLLSGYYESCVLLRRKLSLNAQILHIQFIVTQRFESKILSSREPQKEENEDLFMIVIVVKELEKKRFSSFSWH